MGVTWDAILGAHLNPLTCGVAKFNQRLSERLGLPVAPITTYHWTAPLISIHPREVRNGVLQAWARQPTYDVFLHSEVLVGTLEGAAFVRHARTVFVAHRPLADHVRAISGREAVVLWAPSLLEPPQDPGRLQVLTFGMAHKAQMAPFRDLVQLLDGADYTVRVSTGIHEGTPWAETFQHNDALLRSVFGDRVRMLGFLGDEMLQLELTHADVVALFYQPAARANNTTLWSALEAGCTVITNLDAQSPSELVHGLTCYDLARLVQWPLPLTRAVVRRAASGRGWDAFVTALQGVPA